MSAAPRPLLLFPRNGNALEALACVGADYAPIGFIDDNRHYQGTDFHGLPVFARDALEQHPDAAVLAVPGSPTSYRFRRIAVDSLEIAPERWARVIHPSARISPLAKIGRNVLIMAGVVVTANAVIGDHVCILPNTVIHHDAVIGAWSLIGSGVCIAGSVKIEENCYIGSGSSLINGVRIGHQALVGLGSTVIRPVAAGRTVAGSPARPL